MVVSFLLNVEQLMILDNEAKRQNLSRSEWIKRQICNALNIPEVGQCGRIKQSKRQTVSHLRSLMSLTDKTTAAIASNNHEALQLLRKEYERILTSQT